MGQFESTAMVPVSHICDKVGQMHGGDAPLALRCLVSVLFPSFAFPSADVLMALSETVHTGHVLGAAGYGASVNARIKEDFCRLWEEWFAKVNPEGQSFLDDPITCLGLAWGLRCWGNAEAIAHFEQQLLPLMAGQDSEFAEFLCAMIHGELLASGLGEATEFSLFLQLWGNGEISKDKLNDYYLRMRMQPCPAYADDPVRSLLSAYVMQLCISQCFFPPERIRELREESLQEERNRVSRRLDALVKTRANRLHLSLHFAGAIAYVALFVEWARRGNGVMWLSDHNNWFKDTLFLSGGLLPLIAYLLRLLYFHYKDTVWKWDFAALRSSLENHMRRRWRKRLGL